MADKYVCKLLHPEGRRMYFHSWGVGLTGNLKKAHLFNNDFQAREVFDKMLEHGGLGLFHCKYSEAKEA